jgi:hypothetical protein
VSPRRQNTSNERLAKGEAIQEGPHGKIVNHLIDFVYFFVAAQQEIVIFLLAL